MTINYGDGMLSSGRHESDSDMSWYLSKKDLAKTGDLSNTSPELLRVKELRSSQYISGRHISVIDSFSQCNLHQTDNSAAPICSGASN